MRPLRSTRSRNTRLPMSRRAMTRPATRRFSGDSCPGSNTSASARIPAVESRSGNRLGRPPMAASLFAGRAARSRPGRRRSPVPSQRPVSPCLHRRSRAWPAAATARAARLTSGKGAHGGNRAVSPVFYLGSLDLEDLELERAARGGDLDHLALLPAEDRPADRRLVRELVLRWIRLGRADDPVLERLVGVDVPEPDRRADRD